VSDLAGEGAGWPQLSPDGHYLVSTTMDGQKLKLFDFTTKKWSDLVHTNIGWTQWSADSKYVYFDSGASADPAIYRVSLASRQPERIASLKDFRRVVQPWASWMGLTPDGSPLLLHDTGTQEVYALDFEAPWLLPNGSRVLAATYRSITLSRLSLRPCFSRFTTSNPRSRSVEFVGSPPINELGSSSVPVACFTAREITYLGGYDLPSYTTSKLLEPLPRGTPFVSISASAARTCCFSICSLGIICNPRESKQTCQKLLGRGESGRCYYFEMQIVATRKPRPEGRPKLPLSEFQSKHRSARSPGATSRVSD